MRIYSLYDTLQSEKDSKNITMIQEKMIQSLATDTQQIVFIENILTSFIFEKYSVFLDKEFFNIQLFLKENKKIVVNISFLLQYNNSIDDFDNVFLKFILEKMWESHIYELFSEINVNSVSFTMGDF